MRAYVCTTNREVDGSHRGKIVSSTVPYTLRSHIFSTLPGINFTGLVHSTSTDGDQLFRHSGSPQIWQRGPAQQASAAIYVDVAIIHRCPDYRCGQRTSEREKVGRQIPTARKFQQTRPIPQQGSRDRATQPRSKLWLDQLREDVAAQAEATRYFSPNRRRDWPAIRLSADLACKQRRGQKMAS